jgi:Flp pilus assembly protein TadB
MYEATHMALYLLAAVAAVAGLVWYIRQRRRNRELIRSNETKDVGKEEPARNSDLK